MFLENKKIPLKPGGILTCEMAEEIYNFPRQVLSLQYIDFGDGILSGLNFLPRGEEIFLSAGIVKFNDDFYFLREEVNLTEIFLAAQESLRNTLYHFVLLAAEKNFEHGIEIQRLELKILPESERGLIELGTFSNDLSKLNLPTQSVELENLHENFSRRSSLDLLDVPYSCKGGATFHPYIFSAVKSVLKSKQQKNFSDYVLLAEIENRGVVSLETLQTYIADADLQMPENFSRKEIFETFTRALGEKKSAPLFEVTESADMESFDDDEDGMIF